MASCSVYLGSKNAPSLLSRPDGGGASKTKRAFRETTRLFGKTRGSLRDHGAHWEIMGFIGDRQAHWKTMGLSGRPSGL